MATEHIGIKISVDGSRTATRALQAVDQALSKFQKTHAGLVGTGGQNFADNLTRSLKALQPAATQAAQAIEKIDKAVSQGALGSRLGGASITSGIDKTLSALRQSGTASLQTPIESVSKYQAALTKLKSVFPQVNQAVQAFSQATGVNVPIVGNAANSLSKLQKAFATIPPSALAAGAAIVAVTAGLAALTALGSRGAALQPTITAFGNLFGASADTTKILGDLREQTRGTISDMELMRLSVSALQGTSSQFRQIVGSDLGSIIDLTSRIAQASGQSADVVREKFLLGLRRQSKLLLDDVGVVLDATKVYQDYAKSIGVTTSALTDQQKQAAYAQAAITKLKEIGAEIGTPAKTLEDLKAPFVAIQNIIDKLSIAILPLFAPFAAGVASVFRAFESGVTTILPVVEIFSQFGGVLVELTGKFVAFVFSISPASQILSAIGSVIPYVVASFQLLREAVISIASAAGPAIAALGATIRGGLAAILPAFPQFGQGVNDSLSTLPFDMARSGAKIIGSFATGILQGGNKVVQAVTAIATIVVDFLQGFSPPKKGPLSTIDQGGANVAKAWGGGFLDGFQQTAAQAAQFVTDQLGDIAGLAIGQVTARLGLLDQALQPFNEQLTIAKGIFEQIAGVADPALKVINRQLEAAIKAKDSQAVQRLDAQAAALKQLKAEQQGQLDNAELQLALAKAQQAQERALLTVQKERLGGVSTAEAAAGGAGAGAAERAAGEAAAKAAGGAGAGAAGAAEIPAAFQAGQAPDILSTEAVQRARAQIQAAAGQAAAGAAQGFEDSGFDEALGEITASTGNLQTQLGRIATARPGDKIGEQLAGITQKLAPVKQAFTDLQTTIQTAMNSIGTVIATAFGPDGTITLAFSALFGEGQLLGAGGAVQTAITSLFGPDNPLTIGIPLIQTSLDGLVTKISGAFTSIKATLAVAEATFTKFKTTIETVLDAVSTKAGNIPSGISSALTGLGKTLSDAMVVPFVNAINGIIGAVNSAFNNVLNEIRSIGGVIAGALGVEVPNIQIPLISVPGAARGGVGLQGLHMVGENGPELVNLSRPSTVFPNDISRLIEGLAVQSRRLTIPENGRYGNSTTSNQTINSTFNVGSTEQARLVERQRMAFMGL